jgi:hypothetical protein
MNRSCTVRNCCCAAVGGVGCCARPVAVADKAVVSGVVVVVIGLLLLSVVTETISEVKPPEQRFNEIETTETQREGEPRLD